MPESARALFFNWVDSVGNLLYVYGAPPPPTFNGQPCIYAKEGPANWVHLVNGTRNSTYRNEKKNVCGLPVSGELHMWQMTEKHGHC